MPSTPQNGPTTKSLSILVVEDSAILQKVFHASFGNTHRVLTAPTIEKGWEAFLEAKPHIVFMDINLPDGSGHDLAAKIKEHAPSTYIAIITVSHAREDKIKAVHNHADGFILKPFDKQALLQHIDRYTSKADRQPKDVR